MLTLKGISGGDKLRSHLESMQGKSAHVRAGILEGATHHDPKTGKSTPQALIAYAMEFGAEIDIEEREQVVHFRKTKNGQVRFSKPGNARYSMKTKVKKHRIVIPPRAFMRTAVKSRIGAWRQILARLVKKHEYSYTAALFDLGKTMVVDFRRQIDATTSPPLAPSTLARKNGKGKVLIHTRQMYRALAHEVANNESE